MAHRIEVRSKQREELVDITPQIRAHIKDTGIRSGVLHLWSLHTTCGLTVNEGADPDVAVDLIQALRRIVPREGDYRHIEGEIGGEPFSNSDAHVKTSLFGPGLTLLIEDGGPVLGTWQRVFLAEWDGPRSRRVAALAIPAE